jgi:phage shock protein A
MFRRLMNLIRGFFGMFVSGMERRNPEALLEVEKENLRRQIGQFNQGLASHAALCERLMVQTKKLESEEQELKAKTSANLRAGNREVAGQYALRLQTVSRELGENRTQMQQAEETYKNLVKARDTAISSAQAKIEALKNSINDLKVKRAMSELSEMASGMVTNIGGSGDTLDRLQSMVEEERQKAAGKARVAKDMLNMGEIQIKEAEQNALAEQALADFAAKQGIALDPKVKEPAASDTAEAAYKSMGPTPEAQK